MTPLLDWIPKKTLVLALGLSAGITIGSLALAPLIIARLPADYFQKQRRGPRSASNGDRPLLHFTITALKNLLGIGLIVAGTAMIVLPGQGLLTLIVGLSLVDFPGKHRLINALVERPVVLRSVNLLRTKLGRPPFATPAAA